MKVYREGDKLSVVPRTGGGSATMTHLEKLALNNVNKWRVKGGLQRLEKWPEDILSAWHLPREPWIATLLHMVGQRSMHPIIDRFLTEKLR